MHKKCKPSGFSFLELIVVITIIGALAAIVVPRIGRPTDQAKESCAQQQRAELNAALERYQFATNSIPPDLETLRTDGYFSEPIPLNPVTNEPFELDTTKGRIKLDE